MRRFSFLFLAMLLVCAGAVWANPHIYSLPSAQPAQASLLDRTENALLAEIDVPELQFGQVEANGAAWDVLAVESLGVSGVTGAPLLPVWTRLIAVGPAEGVSVRVVEAEVETQTGLNVLPYQLPIYRSATTVPDFVIDENIYTTDALWPSEPIQIDEPVIIHGRRFVPVHFYPVQYNPVRGEIRHARRAVLEVTGGLVDTRNMLRRELPSTTAFAPIIADLSWSFDRKAENDNWMPVDGAILILAMNPFAEAIQPYIEWKRRKGLTVEVLLTSDIPGEGQDGRKIKEALYQRYHDATKPPLDYVILVGDYEQVTTLFGLYGCSSDSRFATLDGADYFPDTIVARFSAKTVEGIGLIARKMVAYEQNPPLENQAWYNLGTTISGSDIVWPDTNDDLNAQFVGGVLEGDGGFAQVDYFFASNWSATPANITNAINQGRSWVAYFGHGAANQWSSTSPAYTNQHVMALQNNRMLPVVTSVACTNGAFDFTADCFAEVWIKTNENTGAAGIFAASRSTPFGYSDMIGRGTAVGHFRYSMMTFGAASYFAKMYMYQKYPEPSGSTTEEVFQHYLIFGDPELNIWSAAPATMAVTEAAKVEEGGYSLSLEVKVNDTPLPGALVHVWREGEFDAAVRTDESGAANLEFDTPLTPGLLTVFVTGYNALPYEGQIEVLPAVDDDVVDDDVADDDMGDDDVSDDDLGDDDAGDDDAVGDDNDDDDDSSGGSSCGS
ncbi:MAG: C25 family cysteine peptidase [Alphaproteobacteria bacterium]